MDFFEGLERGLGSQGFKFFTTMLLQNLGSYFLLLRETCKRFYFTRMSGKVTKNGQNLALLGTCCTNGNINILDYMVEHNWSMRNFHRATSIETKHLSVVKWAEQHPYAIDVSNLIANGCKNGYKDIVLYGVQQQICDIRMCFEHTEDLEILNMLLVRVGDIAKEAQLYFHYVKTEAKVRWMLNHQHIPYFDATFNGFLGPCRVAVFVEHANSQKWTDTRLINYCIGKLQVLHLTWKYPQNKCVALTDAVAKAFPSSSCECGDPANHERRNYNKRIKI